MASRGFSRWMDRHISDGYVKQSIKDGYRSRSAYKLLEINEKTQILKNSFKVLELGSAPGGWSQVLTKTLPQNFTLISVDLLPMSHLHNCTFLQKDIRSPTLTSELSQICRNFDLILSDVSPNHSGITDIDHFSIIDLHLQILSIASELLRPGGSILLKMLMGSTEPEHFKTMKKSFESLVRVKPRASRQESKEIFYCGKGWNGKI